MSAHNSATELHLAPFAVTDPGTGEPIGIDRFNQEVALVIAAGVAETNTLPDPPKEGCRLRLFAKSVGSAGTRTVTAASALNAAGDLTMVFAAVDAVAVLESFDVGGGLFEWRIVFSYNVTGLSGLSLFMTGSAASSALLLGAGTNAAPTSTSTADKNFLDFRSETNATSGDNRLLYLRYAMEGTGTTSGECIRAQTLVNNNIATAHGAHIGLTYEAVAGGSETSGLGAAIRGTVIIPDVASWAPTGSVYAGMLELYSNGAASDPAGLTELAVLCLSNSGNATGAADVDTDAAVLAVNGFTAANDTTSAVSSISLAELPTCVGISVNIDGARYYIPAVAAAGWN